MKQSILVRSPNWIGDQILALPFYDELRKRYPNAWIAASSVPWVKDLQFRNLVDEVIVLSKPEVPSLLGRWKQLQKSSQEVRNLRSWDIAYCLPNSFSSAWFLFRSGANRRIGYRTEARGFLLNSGRSWDGPSRLHRSEAYQGLLAEAGLALPSAKAFWDQKEHPVFDWKRSWPGFHQLPVPTDPYWILAPGATATSRQWETARFSKLTQTIFREWGLKPLIVGGPKEAPLADQILRESQVPGIDGTAAGPLPSQCERFLGGKFFVGNESGLSHFGSLLGLSTYIVCGAADPKRTRPIGPGRVQVMINPVECWPCERNQCYLEASQKNRCLMGIESDRVWEEIRMSQASGGIVDFSAP